MREENYARLLWGTLALSVLILVAFQLYINREPARIQTVMAADRERQIAAGRELYTANCATCHGEEGEGVDAPPLNSKQFLAEAHDEVIFNIIASGVPGTEMPAWSQVHGGPFTDEEIRQIVAFIRSWEPTAPDLSKVEKPGDPSAGLAIYNATCIVCHGAEGRGTELAPPLNDPQRLAQFDDKWYAETIARGRPSKRMPTWGTILSPQEIRDLVALLRAWERGETVVVATVGDHLEEAEHALGHGEMEQAEHHLKEAIEMAEGEVKEAVEQVLQALMQGDKDAVRAALDRALELAAEAAPPAPPAPEAPAAPTGELPPGAEHLQQALHALEHEELDEAEAALREALDLLPAGDLKEAAEHALEDIEAGKPEEALGVLAETLEATGIPPLEEAPPEATPEATVEPTPKDAAIEPTPEEATTAAPTPAPTATEAPTDELLSGVEHLRQALHALEHGELDEARAALQEALDLLPAGDLKEAAEHALEDIEAGKPEEAARVLEQALADVEQP